MISDNLIDQAYALLNEFKHITIPLVMRRLKLDWEAAAKVCQAAWRRQHLEARNLAREVNGD